MPSPIDHIKNRFSREGRAFREADKLDQQAEQTQDPAAQARLDAHLDQHREQLESHPQFNGYYTEKDWEKEPPEWKHAAAQGQVVDEVEMPEPQLHAHQAAGLTRPEITQEQQRQIADELNRTVADSSNEKLTHLRERDQGLDRGLER